MFTQARLKQVVHYDPLVGLFMRKQARAQAPLGSFSQSIDSKGYRRIRIDSQRVLEHRLAWFYMTGEWPPEEIDHINGVRTDNAFSNLRLADRKQNKRNTKTYKNNKSGFKGVSWSASSKRWKSRFFKDGKEVNLGLYDTPEEAHAAYIKASVENFGEYARVDT